ncbi:tryptophan-rich sensory protein [Cellulomonas dongxiuzhuiae]|uniref:Tryptophan-rich sensory protein n=1 Tax=Cellulomonas dongxiuzhuiae TaxID=2819979 RepID=A0ABX8GL71_9CELL|nr:tryptophan-rich sensory protein [Cellulomonas dongxiuzhuiae]MBO3095374.1 tryptophan-rich sensory protein [Cellulomonas dongxiuzhuiae]QWC16361.1 tryptophan-rich sensory protein [Cellulomonas dongxiuzhuiae]
METITSTAVTERVTSQDRVRQVTVLVGAVVAVVGATVGSGAFGGQPIAEAAGGALSATATPVAPDSPAFSIWSVIYTGLAVFAIVQALPRNGADPRLRAISWWVLASMLLNALWIAAVQVGSVAGSVVVIVVLLGVLATMYVRLVRLPHTRTLPSVVTDLTVGLYTGWVSVATLANTAAFLADAEVSELGLGATGWSVVLVSAAALLAVTYGAYGRRRPTLVLPIGLAMAWGLTWIGLGRTNGPLFDDTVATAAFVAAGVALLAPVVATLAARRR